MGKEPRISIVTPSFNQAEYLEECILSVLNQNYPNLEYIVIDGGSNDGSVEIIKKYSSALSHWESVPDSGHGDALNKGFRLATGDILCWLNSDDLLLPWSLKTVSELFITYPNVSWIHGVQVSYDSKGRIQSANQKKINVFDFLLGNYAFLQQESSFWRRSLWDQAGSHINTDLKLMVDGELWSRFFLFAEPCHINCTLGGWRNTGKNRSSVNQDLIHEEMRLVVEYLRSNCTRSALNLVAQLEDMYRTYELIENKPGSRMSYSLPQGNVNRYFYVDILRSASYLEAIWDSSTSKWRLFRSLFRDPGFTKEDLDSVIQAQESFLQGMNGIPKKPSWISF